MRGTSVVLAVALLCLTGFAEQQGEDLAAPVDAPAANAAPGEHSDVTGDPRLVAVGLAPYEEIPVTITPRVPAYTVKPDLANVVNVEHFEFSEEAQKLLADNLFFVSSEEGSGHFFPLYEENRYDGLPSFITTDSILHTFHLFFDLLMKEMEEDRLSPELAGLSTGMREAALAQHAALSGTQWESAARRAVGFFAVACRLLDPTGPVPAIVAHEVDVELALIAEQGGIRTSPVMMIGRDEEGGSASPEEDGRGPLYQEDYSQFIPRGRYTKTEELERYFQSMMWYGRKTFLLRDIDHVRTAALIVLALDEDTHLAQWERICEPVDFFVGRMDDISYREFKQVLLEVYGPALSLERLVSEEHRFPLLLDALRKLSPPLIASMEIDLGEEGAGSTEEQQGFRFMGQRFTMDALIIHHLTHPRVRGRYLPSGLDIPAALGCDVAPHLLEDAAVSPRYSEQLGKVREMIRLLPDDTWRQNLYWGWLHALRPLTGRAPEGYPSFMRNDAWARKQMNTFLGSWAELKHDTILYAKQPVMSEWGDDWPVHDDRGYVEPYPDVYGRVASLSKMIRIGLEQRDLLDHRHAVNLERLETLALQLKTIAEKQLSNTALSDAEFDLIRSYGATLEHFWLEVHRREMQGDVCQRDFMNQNPAAIVADVATDAYHGKVLQVGTGWVYDMYVIVPVGGTLRIAKGAVYSYYEFPWPMGDRLNNQKWRKMLNSREAPPSPPSWAEAFRAP